MKLSQLVAKTRPITFEFDGETVHAEVRAHVLTPHLVAEMAVLEDRTASSGDRATAMAVYVARLVASWDVLGDDGQPFPLDAQQLAEQVPAAFLSRVLLAAANASGEAMAPGGTSGATSGAGS